MMVSDWKSLDEISLSGQRILTRVDYNVPMQRGLVMDATRIERSKPTLDTILAAGGVPVLISHLGRPKSAIDKALSLTALRDPIAKIIGAPVTFCEQTIGPLAAATTHQASPGSIVLLENLRFDPREQANDPQFASFLAKLGDIYCNDAFSASHRSHASIVGITDYLPCCVGRLMETELNALKKALDQPERPLMAVVGGAKISNKISLIKNLLDKADILFAGGAMANTFRAAQGKSVGRSLIETDMLDVAQLIMEKAKDSDCQLILPIDWTIAPKLENTASVQTIDDLDTCPDDQMILDIGPSSTQQIGKLLQQCATLVWNGPLGAFEVPPFDRGSTALARQAVTLTKEQSLLSYAGGGDTISALNATELLAEFTYVSTAGGAFLEWMEGRPLPGIVALEENNSFRP